MVNRYWAQDRGSDSPGWDDLGKTGQDWVYITGPWNPDEPLRALRGVHILFAEDGWRTPTGQARMGLGLDPAGQLITEHKAFLGGLEVDSNLETLEAPQRCTSLVALGALADKRLPGAQGPGDDPDGRVKGLHVARAQMVLGGSKLHVDVLQGVLDLALHLPDLGILVEGGGGGLLVESVDVVPWHWMVGEDWSRPA